MSDVPEGYKMSEVGVIPEGWDVETLGDIFTFGGGYSASWDQLSSDGYCYLHYGDIHKSVKSFIDVRAEYSEIPKLNILLKRISPKSLLHDGDIVFVDASEDDEGTSKHIVVVNNENITYISGLHTIVAKSKVAVLDNEYKRYCFQSRDIKKQFYFYAVGTKVSGISKTNIAKLKLPIPPLPEQQAIASALSDVDALITALEQLITKKRNIKQGAMQQLLTGEKRLPGFGGGWKVKKLEEIASGIASGKSKLRSSTGIYPVYGSTGILGSYDFYDYEGKKILVARVGANAGTINVVEGKYCVSDNTLIIQFNENMDILFFYYQLSNCKLNRLVFGSGQPLITGSQLKDLSVSLPHLSEQQAIAQILSDMDAEIEALKQKQAKYKAIKQGMMQELLTGKTRLV